MFENSNVALIIPVLNEAGNIGPIISRVDRGVVDQVIIVDNGSVDNTAQEARDAGATVVTEQRRGYGSACLKGIATAEDAQILVFMDGDGSDESTEIPWLLQEMHSQGADMVIGSRVTGNTEPGALTPVQRFGNALTCRLVRLFWNVDYSDLGPFRAITRPALDRLEMSDPDFGWTIEMQVKAAQLGMKVVEVPVTRRNRQLGVSKISGNLKGSYLAGKRILGYVFSAKLAEVFSR